MRLSPENARRLSRLVWRDRARRWVPVIAAAAVGLVGLAYVTELQIGHIDRTIEVKVHDATVIEVKRSAARGAGVIAAHLDDGRDVDAVSGLRVAPAPGTHIVVNEAVHASGRHSFDVVRVSQ